MIEQIQGNLIKKTPIFCVVDCAGIGIGIHISLNTYEKLTSEGDFISLLTYLHVREDALILFGFSDEQEREIFKLLIGISGIGPKLAITILSGLTVSEFVQAVSMENYHFLVKIPGVGKKTAQRVVLELKEKVRTEIEAEELESISISAINRELYDEAVSALFTLGYRRNEAKKAVEKILQINTKEISVEQLIKLALKEI
jgi:Holliday junction DNA helicase RuvA